MWRKEKGISQLACLWLAINYVITATLNDISFAENTVTSSFKKRKL